jgi:transcriptional regulator with XRE-family HTH domain
MTFTKLLAEIRAHRGRGDINQADLAVAAGIAPATFARRIAAGGGEFTVDELVRIATALDIGLVIQLDGLEVIDSTEVLLAGAGKPVRRLVKT